MAPGRQLAAAVKHPLPGGKVLEDDLRWTLLPYGMPLGPAHRCCSRASSMRAELVAKPYAISHTFRADFLGHESGLADDPPEYLQHGGSRTLMKSEP